MRARLLVLLTAAGLALLAPLALPHGAHAAPGDLDPRFSHDGFGQYPVDDLQITGVGAVAVVPQAGGKSLLVGNSYAGGEHREVTFLRLGADGEPDPTYGTDGVVTLPASVGSDAVDAVELPGGDLLVLANGAVQGGSGAYALSRVTPAGALVTSFGDGGTVVAGYHDFTSEPCPSGQYGSCGASAGALALSGAGHVVVGAQIAADGDWTDNIAPDAHAAVARHDVASGDLDLGFGVGDDGTTVLDVPSGLQSWGGVAGIAVEPTGGRILVLEEVYATGPVERALVHRVDPDGAVDQTFGEDGRALVRFRPDVAEQHWMGERPTDVVALAGGGIAISGRATYAPQAAEDEWHGVVARLTETGAADTAFGEDGVVVTARPGEGQRGFDALTVVDGTLYAAGFDRLMNEDLTWEPTRTWLARLDEDGLDTAFGQGGSVAAGMMTDVAALAPAAGGFLLVAGNASGSNDRSWAAARFDLLDARQPENETLPTVTAPDNNVTLKPGETATADDGTWVYGDTIARQWQRCTAWREGEKPATSPAGCTDIAGATGTTYTAVAGDVGKHLRVVVTSASGTFTATAASMTLTVESATLPEPPAFTSGPSVTPSGSVVAGSDVRAVWEAPGATSARVSWYHCPTATTGPCFPVPADDTTDDRYTTSAADVGKFLRAMVTLVGPGGENPKETSNATGVTAAGGSAVAPKATAAPAIAPAGSVEEGASLTRVSDGTWDQDGLAFTYRWERCDAAGICASIPGAGGTSYVTGAADAGAGVRLVVEARRDGGPAGVAVSAVTAVTAKPGPVRQEDPPPAPRPPAPPAPPAPPKPPAPSGPAATQDTTTTVAMPDVRGLQVDAAKARIAAAGIHADVDAQEVVRAKPLKLPGKDRLDVGDVSGQSLAPGTRVTTSMGTRRAIRLVTEAGPRATAANGGPSGAACTGKAVRDDLRGLGLGEVLDLLRAKRCTRVDVDFVVSAGAREVEVRRAEKDGRELALTVTVPESPARMDLTPVFRQGAFNGRPSFGQDDWALTVGAMNVFGVQVLNRAGLTVDGAEVFVDGSKVGADDVDRTARDGLFITGFRPERAGMVHVLVVQRDARGNRIFGFGRFRAVERRGPFTAIDGQRWTARGKKAAGARAAAAGGAGAGGPAARAATVGWWDALVGFARDLGLGGLFGSSGAAGSQEQTLTTAARQNAGQVQLALGNPLSAAARVVSAGGANVVSAGGANVVSAGGGNVVSAGGGNLVSLAKGNVVAAGGGNLVGGSLIKNGTGQLLPLPSGVVAAGGGNVVAVGGGNVIAAGGGNVVAAGGANVVAVGGGNVVAAGGGN